MWLDGFAVVITKNTEAQRGWTRSDASGEWVQFIPEERNSNAWYPQSSHLFPSLTWLRIPESGFQSSEGFVSRITDTKNEPEFQRQRLGGEFTRNNS